MTKTAREIFEAERDELSRKCRACSPADKTCDQWCATYRRFNELQLTLARIDRREREAVAQ